MHTIHTLLRAARVAAVTVFTTGAGLGLAAQQVDATQTYRTPNLQAVSHAPANLFDTTSTSASAAATSSSSAEASSTSSSSADATDAVAVERANLGSDLSGEMQPPPRRRYGRPRYTDSSHNPDGSNKYTFEIGGGLTLPTGGTHNDLKTSYSFQGGVGRNFNKNLGVIAQFDWDNFGVQTAALNKLLAIYNDAGATDQNGNSLSQLNGSSHIWSFTLNPIYNFAGGEKLGAYAVAGAGFYHKVATFTIPAVGEECSYYYGCFEYQANEPIDSYTSNAVGVNLGVGFTYKLSRFANERLFGEVRYVYTANSRRPYYDGVTGTSLSSTYFNAFPQNSAPTTYVPVKFGLRF